MPNEKLPFIIADIRSFPNMIPDIALWHHQQWAHLNPGQTLADRIEKMQQYCLAGNAGGFSPTLFIALDSDGALIGTAALDAQDMDCLPELTPWLASVFVLPKFRRRGVASALIGNACKVARNEMGVSRLYLFTPDQRAFYCRLGWVWMRNLSYYGERVDLMCLEQEA